MDRYNELVERLTAKFSSYEPDENGEIYSIWPAPVLCDTGVCIQLYGTKEDNNYYRVSRYKRISLKDWELVEEYYCNELRDCAVKYLEFLDKDSK